MSNELVDIEGSSIWLTKACIGAKDEAHLCYLHEWKPFGGAPGTCPYCKESVKTVDHLETQCSRMLGHG